jgi:hypothetical protein
MRPNLVEDGFEPSREVHESKYSWGLVLYLAVRFIYETTRQIRNIFGIECTIEVVGGKTISGVGLI